MMNGMMTPKYSIGDRVFYDLQDGEEGIILDIAYYFVSKTFHYLVGLDFNNRQWVGELEISEEKRF